LLVSRKRAADSVLIDALKPLIGSIDVTTMREANARASNGTSTPDEVARWLAQETSRKR
jgi:osmoprotectant transport system permease protein